MATKEQIAANRNNAKLSTGPKSQPGKDKSKFNRLDHGLRAETPVLPTEDRAKFDAFRQGYFDDFQPADSAAAELVDQAATAAWRRKRCVRVETERLTRRIRDAVADARRAHEQRLDWLVAAIDDDPRDAVASLRSTRSGVLRLAAMWRALAEASATTVGWNLFEEHHVRLFSLLGHKPGDPEVRPFFEPSWRLYLTNAPEIADPSDDEFRPASPEQAAEAAAWVHEFTLSQVGPLEELASALPDEFAAVARRAEAEALASTPEDMLLLRYESQRVREFHRAYTELRKLVKSAEEAEEAEPAQAVAEKPDASPSSEETCDQLGSFGNSAPTGPPRPGEPGPAVPPTEVGGAGPGVRRARKGA